MEFRRRFTEDWSGVLQNDPFYNRNLSLNNEEFVGFRDYPVEEQLGDYGNGHTRAVGSPDR